MPISRANFFRGSAARSGKPKQTNNHAAIEHDTAAIATANAGQVNAELNDSVDFNTVPNQWGRSIGSRNATGSGGQLIVPFEFLPGIGGDMIFGSGKSISTSLAK